MPSHTDTTGLTKASNGALGGGKSKCSIPRVGLEPTTHCFKVAHTDWATWSLGEKCILFAYRAPQIDVFNVNCAIKSMTV